MFKNPFFSSFHQWKECLVSGIQKAAWGICRIVTCVIFGIASVFIYCGKQIEAFCRRETVAAVIIALVFALMSAGWLYTFVNWRTSTVTAQHAADSLSYSLDRLMQAYDSVIVDGDTLKFNHE